MNLQVLSHFTDVILNLISLLKKVNRLLRWNLPSNSSAKTFALYLSLVFGERVTDPPLKGRIKTPFASESLNLIILHDCACFFPSSSSTSGQLNIQRF